VARRNKEGEAEYLVVHRPRYDDWSLPKGKLDRRESFLDGALRETKEETGFLGKKPRPVGSVGYFTKAGNPKVVRWWLVDVKSGRFRSNKEVDKVKWLNAKKAMKKLGERHVPRALSWLDSPGQTRVGRSGRPRGPERLGAATRQTRAEAALGTQRHVDGLSHHTHRLIEL
jgi:8-oxo-dGTP diphosphatase